MTEPHATDVIPSAASKLEQLHASYAGAKARAEAAASELKQITDGIKAELAAAAPDQPRVQLTSTYGPPLALTYVESWRVDATRLKAEAPQIYVQFAKKTGAWQLKAVRGEG